MWGAWHCTNLLPLERQTIFDRRRLSLFSTFSVHNLPRRTHAVSPSPATCTYGTQSENLLFAPCTGLTLTIHLVAPCTSFCRGTRISWDISHKQCRLFVSDRPYRVCIVHVAVCSALSQRSPSTCHSSRLQEFCPHFLWPKSPKHLKLFQFKPCMKMLHFDRSFLTIIIFCQCFSEVKPKIKKKKKEYNHSQARAMSYELGKDVLYVESCCFSFFNILKLGIK